MLFLSIITGSTAALLWGLGDLLAKTHIPSWKGGISWVLWGQAFGTVFYLIFWAFSVWRFPELSIGALFPFILLGFIAFLGYILFFRALEKGKLSLVAPITASWAGVSFLLSAFLLKNPLSLIAWGFLILILVGVVLNSIPPVEPLPDRTKGTSGVPEAIGAAIAWGIFNFFIKDLGAQAGLYFPAFVIKAWGTLFFLYFAIRGKLPIPKLSPRLFDKKNAFLIALPLAALADILGYSLYTIGATRGLLPVVATFGSLFSVFAVLFGFFLLKEKLSKLQGLGIAFILTGSLGLIMLGG